MIEIVASIFAIWIFLYSIWRLCFKIQLQKVKGGIKNHITLPHTEPIEFYFADVSSMSMKVRFCLALAGCKFKSYLMQLPSAGSFETKSQEYLEINPAGTVPVLVHNGHPIHESSDQVLYIANNLTFSDGPKLIPEILDGKWACEYWLRETSIDGEEISASIEQAMKSRLGNCIPMLSLPMFAVIAPKISWKCLFKGVFIRGLHPMQIMTFIFKIFGVKTFYLIPKLATIVKTAKEQTLIRLNELEKRLAEKNTTFIAGNEVTVADIGWAPIVERLDLACWWNHIDSEEFSRVKKYWKDLRELPTYKEAVRPINLEDDFLGNIKSQLKTWKEEYSWFRSMYEHLP